MAQYVGNVNATLFADLTPEQTLELTYRIRRYGSEKPLDKIPQEGLSADYVRRETRRAVAGVSPNGPESTSTFRRARRKRRRSRTMCMRP
jgi:hypothetical protein